MTDNEKLIEEARVAFTEAWRAEDSRIWHLPADAAVPKHTRSRAGIAAALAVFEKAHTPTDDEREALLTEADALVASWDQRGSWSSDSPVGMVMRLAVALRRSEVPEPSVLPTFFAPKPGSTTNRLASEPQGEPSDAEAWAAAHAFAAALKEQTGRPQMVNVEHARAALRAAGVGGVR